jgi:hypothetical protein
MASSPEVSTSAVYAYWKEFDLDNRRPKLDEVCVTVWLQAHAATTVSQSTKQMADAQAGWVDLNMSCWACTGDQSSCTSWGCISSSAAWE